MSIVVRRFVLRLCLAFKVQRGCSEVVDADLPKLSASFSSPQWQALHSVPPSGGDSWLRSIQHRIYLPGWTAFDIDNNENHQCAPDTNVLQSATS